VRHREALRQSEATMRTLLEYASDGIIISRRGGEMTLVNAKVEKMFGYSRAELLDRPIEMLMPERYWSSHVAHRADYLKKPEARMMGHGRLDLVGRRRDGTEFPVEVSLSFVETDEDFLVMSFIKDITERRQTQQVIERNAERIARLYAEAQQEIIARRQVEERLRLSLQEKEVLLKEIHHRVKNNLQAVSNLIYLQANYSQDHRLRQMFTETQNRIKSIALIHERLYQTHNFTQIDFVDYIQGLVKHLISSYVVDPDTVKVQVAGKNVQLDVETAVPLGIIINELVSNSLEHAFPAGAARAGSQTNEITVELQEDLNHQLHLTVRDNGVGLPETIDPATSPSLGLQLVKMLTDHMRGSLELDRGKGTTFRIEFVPLPKGSD
jgi:PAS domain S-box-containing protein